MSDDCRWQTDGKNISPTYTHPALRSDRMNVLTNNATVPHITWWRQHYLPLPLHYYRVQPPNLGHPWDSQPVTHPIESTTHQHASHFNLIVVQVEFGRFDNTHDDTSNQRPDRKST